MVTQTNTNYNLLVLCVPCEQRLPCVPTNPTTNPPLSLKFSFFTDNLGSVEVVLYAYVSENSFLNLKIAVVGLTYPGQRPQCPSLSPHFLLLYCILSQSSTSLFLRISGIFKNALNFSYPPISQIYKSF